MLMIAATTESYNCWGMGPEKESLAGSDSFGEIRSGVRPVIGDGGVFVVEFAVGGTPAVPLLGVMTNNCIANVDRNWL
jgi:hypothetical protein